MIINEHGIYLPQIKGHEILWCILAHAWPDVSKCKDILLTIFADFYPNLAAGERRGSSRASDDAEGIITTR